MQPDLASSARAGWMSLLAKAPPDDLERIWAGLGAEPDFTWLRQPEFGTVMVRGRAGATGAAFNIGEMTVTRCSLRLPDGCVGHAYVPGREPEKARIAAICDALMQGAEAEGISGDLLEPLRKAAAARARETAAKAAATKVEFFTMVRGE